MSQKKRNIATYLLLILFAINYANISFFYHSHTINGFTISHSHFHGKAHAKSGTHTAAEFSLISTLSAFQSLQANVAFAGLGLFLLFLTIIRMGSEQKPVSVVTCHSYLRGPPTLF